MHLFTVLLGPDGILFTEGFRFKRVFQPQGRRVSYHLNDTIIDGSLHRSLIGLMKDDHLLLDGYVYSRENSSKCIVRGDHKKQRESSEGVLVHVRVRLPAGSACDISFTGLDLKPIALNVCSRCKKSLIVHIPDNQHMYVYMNKFLVGVFVSKGSNLEMWELSPHPSTTQESVTPPADTSLSPTIEGKSFLGVLSARWASLVKTLKAWFTFESPTKYPERRVIPMNVP